MSAGPLIEGRYRTFTEQWRHEDTRCTSCGKPLYNRWFWVRYQLSRLRSAATCVRHRKWRGAWAWLRLFSPRDVLWHLTPRSLLRVGGSRD